MQKHQMFTTLNLLPRFHLAVAVTLIVTSKTVFASHSIGAAAAAMQGVLIGLSATVGLVLTALLAYFQYRKPGEGISHRVHQFIVFVTLVYLPFGVMLFYALDKNDLLLIHFLQLLFISGQVIFYFSGTMLWRSAGIVCLALVIITTNLTHPRLVDFYERKYVDNAAMFELHKFTIDNHWRVIKLDDGRRFLYWIDVPYSAQTVTGSRSGGVSRRLKSPIIVEQKDTDNGSGIYDIKLRERSKSSIRMNRDDVFFKLPLMGEARINIFEEKSVANALLLSEGVKIDSKYLYEALMEPRDKSSKTKINSWIRELIDSGSDPNYVNLTNGYSLLMAAISKYRFDAVAWLIEAGVDVNYSNSRGETPLHHAASKHSRFVEILLKHGANPEAKDKNGNTPQDWTRIFLLSGRKRDANGKYVADVESPRYVKGLKINKLFKNYQADGRYFQ